MRMILTEKRNAICLSGRCRADGPPSTLFFVFPSAAIFGIFLINLFVLFFYSRPIFSLD